jgi:hypothetical protein
MGSVINPAIRELSVKKLYKDLIVVARFIGQRNGNEEVLKNQVRESFRAHREETDEARIKQLKEDAMRALGNFYFSEAEKMARKYKK